MIIPAVIAKDQKELNALFKKLKGVSSLHLDVIDNKFAPNSSLQFPFKLKREFTYSAHLMIKNPLPWIKKHLRRVQLPIPHIETLNPKTYISFMKKKNKPVAFALLPETKVSTLKPYANQIDYILLLTVHPGFYGSKFLKSPLKKINQIKRLNPKIKIFIDGHMDPTTIKLAKEADHFISGSYVTKSSNPKKAITQLKKALLAK